jgi:hypothetical protein
VRAKEAIGAVNSGRRKDAGLRPTYKGFLYSEKVQNLV